MANYSQIVTEARLPCVHCNALFHHLGHATHQLHCAKRTPEEREYYMMTKKYREAGRPRKVDVPMYATPVKAVATGERVGMFVTVDAKALQALYASMSIEQVNVRPAALVAPESAHIEHDHRPALPAPAPAEHGVLMREWVLNEVVQGGPGRAQEIADRLNLTYHAKWKRDRVAQHLYALLHTGRLNSNRGLYSAKGRKAGTPSDKSKTKYTSVIGKPMWQHVLDIAPAGQFRVKDIWTALGDGPRPSTMDALGTVLSQLRARGRLERIDTGLYQLRNGDGGHAAEA